MNKSDLIEVMSKDTGLIFTKAEEVVRTVFIWYCCILCKCYFGLDLPRKSSPKKSSISHRYFASNIHQNFQLPYEYLKISRFKFAASINVSH